MEVITLDKIEVMNYRQLQFLAKTWNLKANGKREELLGRLSRHLGGESNENYCTAATPGTPSAARSQKHSAEMRTFMPPTTPGTSLAKAFGRLSLNTPSAVRATPSRYNTRSSARKAKSVHSTLASALDSKPDDFVTQVEPSKQLSSPVLSPAATDNSGPTASRLGGGEAVADSDLPLSPHFPKMDFRHCPELMEPDTVIKSPQTSPQEWPEDEAMQLLDGDIMDTVVAATAETTFLTSEDQNVTKEEEQGANPRRPEEEVLFSTKAAVDSRAALREYSLAAKANAAADASSATTAIGVSSRLVATTDLAQSAACMKLFTEEPEEAEERGEGAKQQREEEHGATDHDNGEETMMQATEGNPRETSFCEGVEFLAHAPPEDNSSETMVQDTEGNTLETSFLEGIEFLTHAPPEDTSSESCHRLESSPADTNDDTEGLVAGSDDLGFTDETRTQMVCVTSGEEIAVDYTEIPTYIDSERVQQLLAVSPVVIQGGSQEEASLSGSTIDENGIMAPDGSQPSTGECLSERSSQVLEVDEETRKLVVGSDILEFTDGEKRVLCSLTGQEIVPEYFEILKYLSSKRVLRLLKEGPFDIQEFAGMFIVEDPVDSRVVRCELTGVTLAKDRSNVKKHLSGQQYRLALQATSLGNEMR